MPSSTGIYAGTDITAAVLARAVPLFAYKATATSVTTDTSVNPDPDLTLTLQASTVYRVELVLVGCSGGSGGGLKYNFTVPSGTTGDYTAVQDNLAGTAQIIDGGGWAAMTNTASPDNGVLIKGMLITSGTGGSFTFNWAQSSSSGTATVVGQFSYLEARQAM